MRRPQNNPSNISTIHQFFRVIDDMDQNEQIINDREMQHVRRQIEINLRDWTKAMTRNQQQIQQVYRQKVMFLFMYWIQLLQTNYGWEYSQQYFPLFQPEWYQFTDWTASDYYSDNESQAESDIIQYKRYFESKNSKNSHEEKQHEIEFPRIDCISATPNAIQNFCQSHSQIQIEKYIILFLSVCVVILAIFVCLFSRF